MKHFRAVLAVALCVLLLITVCPFAAGAAEKGKTGDCLWSLENGVLTVSGSGRMEDYSGSEAAPWGTDVRRVVFDGRIESIGSYAFAGCTLTELTVPDSVTQIGEKAFWYCYGLTRATLGDGVSEIGSYAFAGCWDLRSVSFGSGLKRVGEGAFAVCENLTEVTLPDSAERIDDFAFISCGGLRLATIPAGVTEIGADVFENCDRLVLYGAKDSAVIRYAKENHIPFLLLLSADTVGDVDRNGSVDVRDATALQRFLAELDELTQEQQTAADTDDDGALTIDDATCIQLFSVM